MRMTGLKTIIAAAGLALAGAALAAPPPAPAPGAVAAVPAAAASPELAIDGAPAMSVAPHVGVPSADAIGLQTQVTPNGRRAHKMHDVVLMPTIVLISLFVLMLLGWTMWRYRRAANPVPSRTTHNTFIEVVWTLVPVLILVAIAVPSIGLLSAQFKPAPAGAVTLKAIGNQWFWTYQYPDNGGFEVTANMLKEQGDPTRAKDARFRTDGDGPRLLAADNRIVLPVGVPIRLITTANDVIHSWAVPAFWIKLDAVPGRLNETSFMIEKPGVYFGQCSELCGARHAFMPIAVEAVPPAQFAAWVRAKGGTMGGGAPDAGNGLAAPPSTPAGNPAAAPPAGAGPVENATTAAPAISQPATGNPAGSGNAGQ